MDKDIEIITGKIEYQVTGKSGGKDIVPQNVSLNELLVIILCEPVQNDGDYIKITKLYEQTSLF